LKIAIKEISFKKGFNPRESLDPDYVKRLKESMSSPIGTVQPILVREGDNELIDGAHRIEAAKKAGQKTIECRIIRASDFDARILALTANAFGKHLSDLEIGKAAHDLLSTVKKRAGREKWKVRIARELGMNSTAKLEDCLTSYQQIDPEARENISTAVELGAVKVDHLRRIRTLPHEKQLALTRQIAQVKDPIRVDRLIAGYMATQEPTRTTEQTHTDTTALEEREETERFFSLFKFNVKGRIETVAEGRMQIESDSGPVNLVSELDEALKTVQSKGKPRDILTVSMLLESPVEKKLEEAA